MSLEQFTQNLEEKLGKDNLERIQKTWIGIAGAGGLGSNCALNLVRVGFRNFVIADFDVVDVKNLDRQFYFLDQVGAKKTEALKHNLARINPEIVFKTFPGRLEKSNIKEAFGGCEVVAECFDKAEYKKMLVEELLPLGKFIVTASGLGGCGSSDEIRIHRLKKNLVIVGDLKSDICHAPPLSPRVNIAAAKQADVILEYILKK